LLRIKTKALSREAFLKQQPIDGFDIFVRSLQRRILIERVLNFIRRLHRIFWEKDSIFVETIEEETKYVKLTVFNNGNSTNNGVMSMAVALCKEATNLCPSLKISVVLDNPETAEKDAKRFAECGVHTIRSSLGESFHSDKHLKLFPFFGLWCLLGQLFRRPKNSNKYFHLKQTDAFISLCGEDFFSDNWGIRICLFTFLQCLGAFITRKPLIVLAQTLGPFERGWSRWLARFCLGRARLVTARDANSFKLLRQLGITENSHLTADLGFLLEPDPLEHVIQKHAELRKLSSREYVGISVSKLFGNNVFHYIKDKKERRETFFHAMALSLDDVVERYGLPLVFVPHVFLPHSDDRIAAKAVVARMVHKDRAIILQDEYVASGIKTVIGQARLFIGCRMHALIASVSQGVPTLSLAYSPKTLDVIGDGLEYKHIIDVRNLPIEQFRSSFLEHVSSLLANEDSVRMALLRSVETKARNGARRNIELVLELLEIDRHY
jgi:polysaccharide pyruvyl transferase WcaK-like protein